MSIGPEEAKIRAQTRVGLPDHLRSYPEWTLVASDTEPPMHFCPDCGADLLPPVDDPNAVQVCSVCGKEQTVTDELLPLPEYLRPETPPAGQCNRCLRKTWSPSDVGTEDRMTQPDGNPCGGRIVQGLAYVPRLS